MKKQEPRFFVAPFFPKVCRQFLQECGKFFITAPSASTAHSHDSLDSKPGRESSLAVEVGRNSTGLWSGRKRPGEKYRGEMPVEGFDQILSLAFVIARDVLHRLIHRSLGDVFFGGCHRRCYMVDTQSV